MHYNLTFRELIYPQMCLTERIYVPYAVSLIINPFEPPKHTLYLHIHNNEPKCTSPGDAWGVIFEKKVFH